MSILQIVWFILLAVVAVGFTALAGFDLGLGVLLFFARNDGERKSLFSGIGPFWDGNEVWLIGLGGLLFAVFPPVYAAVFSGFYVPIIICLLALILRAVAIDFGERSSSEAGRSGWGMAVAVGSALAVLLLGIVLGNLLRGIPLDAQGNFAGSPLSLINSLAVLVGGVNLAMIVTHGALYLGMKTEGEMMERARSWARGAWTLFLTLSIAAIILAVVAYPHLTRNFRAHPALWLLPIIGVISIFTVGVLNERRRIRAAFLASCVTIALLLAVAAVALFPLLIPAQGNPARSLTIANSSSSPLSLEAMLIVTLIGLPLVLIYTAWVYRALGGKIREEENY